MKRIIVLSIILALFPHFGYAQVLPPLFPSGNYLIPRDSAWIIGSSTVEMLANTSTISYLTVTTCVGCAGGSSYDPTWILDLTTLYATDTVSQVVVGTTTNQNYFSVASTSGDWFTISNTGNGSFLNNVLVGEQIDIGTLTAPTGKLNLGIAGSMLSFDAPAVGLPGGAMASIVLTGSAGSFPFNNLGSIVY